MDGEEVKMRKYSYLAGIDMAYGDDKTVMSYLRQRRLRWWEKLLTRFFKSYKISQPLELLDFYEVTKIHDTPNPSGGSDESNS